MAFGNWTIGIEKQERLSTIENVRTPFIPDKQGFC
jgi:uncharacterized protein with NRDE domain